MPVIPKEAVGSSEMDELYGDEEEAEPTEATEAEDGVEKPSDMAHTEMVSNKLLGGKSLKPGDRVILEVVKTYGDETELKYASEESAKPARSEDDELAELAGGEE